MRGLPTLVLVIAYPIAEAATLLWFGSAFGWLTLVIVLALGFFLGLAIMRFAGAEAFRVLMNADQRASAFGVSGIDQQEQIVHGAPPSQADLAKAARDLGKSSLLFLAGLFVALPGLISSAVGIILLLPPVRSFVARRMAASARASAGSARVTVITADPTGFRTQTWSSQDAPDQSHRERPGDAPQVIQGEILPPPREARRSDDDPLSQ